MEAKNIEYHYGDNEVNEVEELLDGCVNHIIIKPDVSINVTIEGLETSTSVETDDNENTNKFTENLGMCNCVNHIVIKPKIKMDVNLKEFNTTVNF